MMKLNLFSIHFMHKIKLPIIGLSHTGLPLLIVKAQAKHLCFLLDTGSNINVLDKRVAEFFQLSGRTTQQQQFGIDGTLQTTDVVEMTFSLEEREYKADFSVMDLSSAFGKVEDETGIQIHGLLGCSFMEQQKWILDFENLTLCLSS